MSAVTRCWFSAVAVLSISTSSSATVLFYDDFDDGDASGWEEIDGAFSITGGAYRIQSTGFSNDARSVTGNLLWGDYSFEADFNMLNREKTAFLFHVVDAESGTDAGKYFQFEVIASQNLVEFCEIDFSGGNCNRLETAPLVISDNEWHHMQLEVFGTSAVASIDASTVLSVTALTKYPTGSIGLKTINSGVTLFDNVRVNAIPEPGTAVLAMTGLIGLAYRRRGHRRLKIPCPPHLNS